MNNFIKQVIEEKFASKAQQRFFYAKANEKGKPKKEKNKWGKWAKENSDDTDYSKIPDKVEKEEEVDEIVDKNGNISRGKKPGDLNTKGVTSNSITDKVVKTGRGMSGNYGTLGVQNYTRYWGEGKEISKEKLIEIAMGDALGYDDTMGGDESFKEAYNHFTKELGLSHEETMERLEAMGYDPKLKGTDKVRLIENPKKFMEEYIESVVKKRKDNDLVSKVGEQDEEKEINPIIKRQIDSLRDSLESNGLTADDIIKHLKKDNE
jgi:hypothetical protein